MQSTTTEVTAGQDATFLKYCLSNSHKTPHCLSAWGSTWHASSYLCVAQHMLRDVRQIYHWKRTSPTDCKLNHVNLGKENPIKKSKINFKCIRWKILFVKPTPEQKFKLLRRHSGHSDNNFKMATKDSLMIRVWKEEPEALNHYNNNLAVNHCRSPLLHKMDMNRWHQTVAPLQ